jgi:hypothetical protein
MSNSAPLDAKQVVERAKERGFVGIAQLTDRSYVFFRSGQVPSFESFSRGTYFDGQTEIAYVTMALASGARFPEIFEEES